MSKSLRTNSTTPRGQVMVVRGSELAAAMAPTALRARQAAVVYGGTAREWAGPRIEGARVIVGPRVVVARDWAAPHVETAVHRARTDVLPAVAAAAAAVAAAAYPVAEEARARSNAAYLALRGELAPPRRRGRGRRTVLLTGLAGGAGAAYYALRKRNADDPWADTEDSWSSSAPASSFASGEASTTSVGAAAAGDTSVDVAGASPDEALADAADDGRDPAPTDVDAAVGTVPVGSSGGMASEVVDPTDEQVTAEEALRQRDESTADARGLRQFP